MRYFRIEEFRCQCGGLYCDGGLDLMDDELLLALDELRGIAGFPFVVNSGYRCPEWNEQVGGVPDSQHVQGRAADIRLPSDILAVDIEAMAELVPSFANGGIGLYDTFIHLDNRDGPARWDRRTKRR